MSCNNNKSLGEKLMKQDDGPETHLERGNLRKGIESFEVVRNVLRLSSRVHNIPA